MSFMALIYGIIIATVGEVVLFYGALLVLLCAIIYFIVQTRRHMKIVLLLLLPFLYACATSPLSTARGDIHDLLASLHSVTAKDLDAATARAQAGGDAIGAACYPILKKYLGMGREGEDQIAGAFDAFEKARLARKSIPLGIPDDLRLGCAALVQDERDFVLRMAAIAGAGAVSGGAAPLIIGPAIPLVKP